MSGTGSQEVMHAQDPAFISPDAFDEACRSLIERSRHANFLGMSINLREEHDSRFLVIQKALPFHFQVSKGKNIILAGRLDISSDSSVLNLDGTPDMDALDNEDSAAFHHFSAPIPTIEYNILLSPSYRVPILYFFLRDLPAESMSSIEAVQSLVPEHIGSGIKETGVMGGISMGNHPITDFPAYFVHPCNTAEAMREIIGTQAVSPFKYLQIWIGKVGSCVGLHLPSQLVL